MALELPSTGDRKRVKVYELRDNDWFDRGTGFCLGHALDDEPRLYVESEDEPGRVLLETRIIRDDGYQKQQETLIVWTEPNGTDMALSFQEPEGCAVIWEFVSSVQQHMNLATADDALSDELDAYPTVMLPPPELGNLPEIEHIMRSASMSQVGRDTLSKIVIRDDYVTKLLPLVNDAEDLESLTDLHRLCNIMKSLILLNDNTIIENIVTDDYILGVVGALEYDPEFPTHKANHRQYLADESRFKEVVPIRDPVIRKKIRCTWRLQYLKDVVLARILDDPTFSVLNSLIFFNQVEIVNHIQSNSAFLKDLFSVFDPRNPDSKRKDDAVQFLHQCAAIAKNLQAPARATLYANFISHGLFAVIAFAVKHPRPAVRTTGIDLLVALLDHDPIMMRGYMLKAVNEKKTPLTDTLIDLLHAETDLGVKNQLADAIKVLLDPHVALQDAMVRAGPDYFAKLRMNNILSEAFVQHHFEESSKRLFMPLQRLANRRTRMSPYLESFDEANDAVNDLTFHDVALYAHLVDIIGFFVRQHAFRGRLVIHNGNLAPRIAQLLTVPQKHLKLTALKFFRGLVGVQDTFFQALLTHNNIFGLILDIVTETMPRDNLLNSACLELFEFIRRENIKPFVVHVVEAYRDRLLSITYVDTFHDLVNRYEQMQGYGAEAMAAVVAEEEQAQAQAQAARMQRVQVNGQHWQGLREMEAAEEAYFSADDDEEQTPGIQNGAVLPSSKPLVDYPDDDDDDNDAMDTQTDPARAQAQTQTQGQGQDQTQSGEGQDQETPTTPPAQTAQPPPERLSEKRRREEEDEDELVKLTTSGPKRRSSTTSHSGSAGALRRKRSMSGADKTAAPNNSSSAPPKKISINIGSTTGKTSTVTSEKENRK